MKIFKNVLDYKHKKQTKNACLYIFYIRRKKYSLYVKLLKTNEP